METNSPENSSTALPQIPETATKYEILGVSQDATAEEVRLAYRRLALLYHPDRHVEADRAVAELAFKRIAAAHETLSDQSERSRYDQALSSGREFREDSSNQAASLVEILVDIQTYEHIFSADALTRVDSTLQEIVEKNLIAELREQIIGAWRMDSPPAGAPHRGTFKAGAVVLTNLRVLLPFTYTWEEQRGSTKYRYRGGEMPGFVFPEIRSLGIISEGRVRNIIWIDVNHAKGTTRFHPGGHNLGKLLLIAREWGIPLEARYEERRLNELRTAILRSWIWAFGVISACMLIGSIVGMFGAGGFLDNPIDLTLYFERQGIWHWLVVLCAAISAVGIWRWIMAYRPIGLATLPPDQSAPSGSLSPV